MEIVVARGERDAVVDAAVARHGVRAIPASAGNLVARSYLDHAIAASTGGLLVVVAPDLSPERTGWLSAMVGPLRESERVAITRGVVEPDPSLDAYDAYRFELSRVDPLDLVAFRRTVWEVHSFAKSGGLGYRWLERARAQGDVRTVDGARVRGRLELPRGFQEIVRSTFVNSPDPLGAAARDQLRYLVGDLEALRGRGADAKTIARAATVRLAELVARSRLRRLFAP